MAVICMAKPKKKYSDLLKTEISYIKKKLGITKIQEIDTAILKQLKERLKQLKDSRNQHMILYKLWDVILCVILASFGDNNSWDAIHDFVIDNYLWLKSFLQMTGGIPTAESYERIMGLVDSKELNQILFEFFQEITFTEKEEISLLNIDGRNNNGSKKNKTIFSEEKAPLNCLNVYSTQYRYCIETNPIQEKSNEIQAVEDYLKGLNLTGTIVTWDALNTQTKNIEAVRKAHGDYIVPVKANQGTFYRDLIDYFDEQTCEEMIAGNTLSEYYTYMEKSHSSIIKYECFQTSDIHWYDRKDEWKDMRTIGMIKKTIIKKVKEKNTRKNAKKETIYKEVTTIEKRYYISSRSVNAEELEKAVRAHWNIENKIHFHLDVTFCQDKNRTSNKNALLNLEIIHKFVLGCLTRVKPRYNRSLQRIRKHISNNFEEFFPEFICYLIVSR